jgi:DNA-binding NarL/FixJ family response regulator
MDSKARAPDWAYPEPSPEGRGVHAAPALVICDPTLLCAEAIAAVVQKRMHWRIACVTTSFDVALVAASACRARALLFTVHDCSPRAVQELVRRIRSASPEIAPVLLSGCAGARVLRSAIAAGARACIHRRDSSSELAEALQAVEEGATYFSESITSALATAPSRTSEIVRPEPERNGGSASPRLNAPSHQQVV